MNPKDGICFILRIRCFVLLYIGVHCGRGGMYLINMK